VGETGHRECTTKEIVRWGLGGKNGIEEGNGTPNEKDEGFLGRCGGGQRLWGATKKESWDPSRRLIKRTLRDGRKRVHNNGEERVKKKKKRRIGGEIA